MFVGESLEDDGDMNDSCFFRWLVVEPEHAVLSWQTLMHVREEMLARIVSQAR